VRSRTWKITLRKLEIPPLTVRKLVKRVVRRDHERTDIHLELPEVGYRPGLTKITYTLQDSPGSGSVLQQMDSGEAIETEIEMISLYAAAAALARNYRLDGLSILVELGRIYAGQSEFPASHVAELAKQVEVQTSQYEVLSETVEMALALVKPDGFTREVDGEGHEVYTAEISYPIDREALLADYQRWQAQAGTYGFHYDPYNFDSRPESSFFDHLLTYLKQRPDEIEDIYFTGGLTDPQKTDFFVEYKGEDGQWHRYTPDFVVRRKDGKCLIVEIKKEHDRQHPVDGLHGAKALATQKWVGLNPERLKYAMIFTAADEIGYDQFKAARDFIEGKDV
jgi:type III restriction enzyme